MLDTTLNFLDCRTAFHKACSSGWRETKRWLDESEMWRMSIALLTEIMTMYFGPSKNWSSQRSSDSAVVSSGNSHHNDRTVGTPDERRETFWPSSRMYGASTSFLNLMIAVSRGSTLSPYDHTSFGPHEPCGPWGAIPSACMHCELFGSTSACPTRQPCVRKMGETTTNYWYHLTMSSCMYGEVLLYGETGQPNPPTSVVHHGTPDSEAATPSGTCTLSSSKVLQMSDDHNTTPRRAAPAHKLYRIHVHTYYTLEI